MQTDSISSLLSEKRLFPPPSSFAEKAAVKAPDYERMCREVQENPDAFWRKLAHENLIWDKPFQTVLDWKPPYAQWFKEGHLNASVQCLDKNLQAYGNKTALIWEGEPGDIRKLTYRELYELTCQTTNALEELGVRPGDRIAIYMPLIPEAVAAMLACARLGAPHSVIFGGFSSEALKDRINDAECSIVITADGSWRRGQKVPLKENVDRALENAPTVKKVLVVKRLGDPVFMKPGRDVWWHETIPRQRQDAPPVSVESEHLLFILYTSGTTGKPKGITHATAGYMLWTGVTAQWVFDFKPDDIYWCTADIGWITGHSYVVYGPLQRGATVLMYEGAPNFPDFGRFWEVIAKHRVTIFYTAPTAIRAFMRAGDTFVKSHDLSSLRLLGSVGEPINPEAWIWYHKTIGKEKCPIVDTWWQTETGGILMSPLPGATPTKPGSCTKPLPGVFPRVVKKDGTPCAANEGGFLILDKPWPAITRGVFKDPDRFEKTYFSDFKDLYFTGDGARCDQDGYFWVMGRVDDVLNVSGHRLGTAEIESALVSHLKVAEAAVVGRPDDLKGQAVVAFVTLKAEFAKDAATVGDELKAHVAREIGAIARPDEIRFTDGLPKTRSGKIMRRLLRELADKGRIHGDVSTLEDMAVINKLAATLGDEE